MYDINYYMTGKRDIQPMVWNIETTNACNMKCPMCPRTTLMTRPVTTMKPELFENIVEQLQPISYSDWLIWEKYVQERYGIYPGEMSENHFFLYILPRVVQLHGHGEPILDKNLPYYIKRLTDKGLQSYVSCNVTNIDRIKLTDMMSAGLGYLKISGIKDDFTEGSYINIDRLLELKAILNLKTTIIVSMVDLGDDFDFMEKFKGKDVYTYLKSENTQWYRGERHENRSIHWSEPCKHPWMSMSISSDGKATTCPSDYDNEIVFGDTNNESLKSIWNGQLYEKFRKDHLNVTKGIRCTDHCDMKLMGELC